MNKLLYVLIVSGLVCALYGDEQVFPYERGKVLVKFEANASPTAYANAMRVAAPQTVTTIPAVGVQVWQVDSATDIPALVNRLNQLPGIEYAEPNYRYYLAWLPNDPLYYVQEGQPGQLALEVVGCPAAWDIWRGSSRFLIAIADTGIDLTHPDFEGKLLPGRDFGNGDMDPSDPSGHGTFVTGIAGAATDNNIGIASICPEVTILPVKIFNDDDYAFLDNVVAGLTWAADQGVHVINMSFSGPASPTLRRTIQGLADQGIVLVGAAGNSNNTANHHPAAYEPVIAVAAANLDGIKTEVSTYGSWVDIAAPSGDVTSTFLGGTYQRNQSGFTSYAAPFVAGEAVLLYSMIADGPQDRSVANAQLVRNLIEQNTAPVPPYNGGSWVAHGLIDVDAAVTQASTVVVHGQVTIEGFSGNYDDKQLVIELRDGSTVLASEVVLLSASGGFSTTFTGHIGNLKIALRTTSTLNRVLLDVQMRYPQTIFLNVSLIPGDLNGDNRIDDADLDAVISDFGTAGNTATDLNADGIVDDTDLAIIVFRFGQQGDD